MEQREWVRYACAADAKCTVAIGAQAAFEAVRIQNVSMMGITLVLDRTVPIGTVASIELSRPSLALTCKRQMRVVYEFKEDGGSFMLGGSFAKPLTDLELQGLL